MITLALQVLETSEFEQKVREAVAQDPILVVLFLGFYAIYTSASHRRIDPKAMADDLRRMGLNRKTIQDIVEPFNEKKDVIEALARQNRITHPSIERLEWRVDVAVTSSQLNRVFKPIILFQITTTSGDIKTFECSMEKFHLLRYSVARMLAAVQNIEQNPTLTRLVD